MVGEMGKDKQTRQRGAVSIFVVVFSALFVTIITVSFVGLMIRGQQQAASADLSNSAYDSALAGVEDAKRMLLKYRQCLRGTTDYTVAQCNEVKAMFASPSCNMVRRNVTGINDNQEMPIQSSTGSVDSNSKALDQAYTCVIVGYTAEEKELQLRDGETVLVPIESNGSSYNKISISWFTKDPLTNLNLNLPSGGATELPTKSAWMAVGANNTRPPIIRAQWIQHSGTFSASDFDSDKTENFKTVANTKSVFLYPNTAGLPAYDLNTVDDRNAASPAIKAPVAVNCSTSQYNFGGYACTVDLNLPDPISNTGVRTGYLQLGAVYNASKIRIKLKNTNDPVPIVAPSIDSTGRANDLFRRVRVGVSFTGEYPRANFEVNGNLCKDFAVTNDSYLPGSCREDNP